MIAQIMTAAAAATPQTAIASAMVSDSASVMTGPF